jgi:crotonobetainyl-CoA:carnitine CoA-transferase CaiB-like acyl-CoA transferase
MAFNLNGIRVVQTAGAMAGPMAGRLLADWGADVICIESTAKRPQMAPVQTPLGQKSPSPAPQAGPAGAGYGTQNVQRNKRSMSLDLSKDAGREIIYKLLAKSDILLSNFRPYELDKFKLDYGTLSRLNPRLILANITGFGKNGPDKNAPGYGGVGETRAGLVHMLHMAGTDPSRMPISFTDFFTGLSLAYGIMTALYIREKTGEGQEVDASLFNTIVWALTNDLGATLVTGDDKPAVGRKDSNPLTNFYQTKDGRWLWLQATNWGEFCQTIGRKDLEHDPRFEQMRPRAENRFVLFDILNEIFLSKNLNEWKSILADKLPWTPVQTLPEVVEDPQARANDFFIPLNGTPYGRMEVTSSPVKLGKTPVILKTPAPDSGQHTEEILRDLNYKQEDIARFREQGAIV